MLGLHETFPFVHKFRDIRLHIAISGRGKLLSSWCVHHIRQQKQFLVKMVDGGGIAAVVFLFTHIQLRFYVWMMEKPVVASAIGEGTGNSDRTNGVQTIGILDALTLKAGGDDRVLAGIRDFVDNAADPVNRFLIHVVFC